MNSHIRPMKGNPKFPKNLIVESGILDFGICIQYKDSGILRTTEIRIPSFTEKESGIQYLESVIHCVESRIQD